MKTIRENVDTDTEEMEVDSPLNEMDVDQNDVNNTKEHSTFQASIIRRSESSGTAINAWVLLLLYFCVLSTCTCMIVISKWET